MQSTTAAEVRCHQTVRALAHPSCSCTSRAGSRTTPGPSSGVSDPEQRGQMLDDDHPFFIHRNSRVIQYIRIGISGSWCAFQTGSASSAKRKWDANLVFWLEVGGRQENSFGVVTVGSTWTLTPLDPELWSC